MHYSETKHQMNYEQIKQLARDEGRKVTDLIVLAPQNDPFYTGTPGDWSLGEWFAALWHSFGYQKAHVRRVHYQIISQDPPVMLPNGKPYENTEECWNILNLASKAARYLRLVDPAAFNDRRNPETVVNANHDTYYPSVRVYNNLYRSDMNFPRFPELPSYSVGGYGPQQEFHIEIFCEKSTMNDVLLPLCERYRANLQTGLGELSITASLAVVQRLAEVGKPTRIFYVSDFDPAGQSMPVAVSRKIEYFVHTLGLDVDVRVFPVVLTQEQVRYYQLPRTPIKDTERRRFGFEERRGEGAVELDALEALYPGELQRVLSQYVEQYYDTTLADRVREEEQTLERDMSMIWQQVMSPFEGDLNALRNEHERLKGLFEGQMASYGQRIQGLWQAMRNALDAAVPDLDDYPLPRAYVGEELTDGLYNSERDYLEQLDAYKLFQGRN